MVCAFATSTSDLKASLPWPLCWCFCADAVQSGRKKTREPKEEKVTLGPTVREGEYVFGMAHIFVSFNDTFIIRRSNTRFHFHPILGGGFGEMSEQWKLLCVFVCAVAAWDGFVRTGGARLHHWYLALSHFFCKSLWYCLIPVTLLLLSIYYHCNGMVMLCSCIIGFLCKEM